MQCCRSLSNFWYTRLARQDFDRSFMATLQDILVACAGKRIVVIGDVMLDEYAWGEVRRISPEAPVPVVEAQRRSYTPGGAANVAANVLGLGGVARLGGAVGDDPQAGLLRT